MDSRRPLREHAVVPRGERTHGADRTRLDHPARVGISDPFEPVRRGLVAGRSPELMPPKRKTSLPPLWPVARRLRNEVSELVFSPPVTHVYNPLDYAWRVHRAYLDRYGGLGAKVLLLGMNPGPWGMSQTGVPFGDVEMSRGWLGLESRVGRPPNEHPKRPVLGFDCPRSEVSGTRLWGWARDAFVTPERFFSTFFVWNYCPLAFMEASGRNRTPDRLPAGERAPLYRACDEALRDVVSRVQPTHVIGIGRFGGERAKAALTDPEIRMGWAPHPSPASPAANRGWAELFAAALERQGIAVGSRRAG